MIQVSLEREETRTYGLHPNAVVEVDRININEGNVNFRIKAYVDTTAQAHFAAGTSEDPGAPGGDENAGLIYERHTSVADADLGPGSGNTPSEITKNAIYDWLLVNDFSDGTDLRVAE